MKNAFSPKQVARAFNVSESSLKRWCDRGFIPTIRTAGGHRRISLTDIVSFVRSTDQPLAKPELLGLPPIRGHGERVVGRSRDLMLAAIARGDENACRQITLELFLSGCRICQICDEVLASVMQRLGELWERGDMEVYQERLGCEICMRILEDCRSYIADPPADAPLAVGATPEGDPYTLATRMAELVLKESGWQSISLGSNLPLRTLAAAVRVKRPRMIWLSVSYVPDMNQFVEDYRQFQADLDPRIAVVLGGKALTESVRRRLRFFGFCDNFQQLGDMAGTMVAGIPAAVASSNSD